MFNNCEEAALDYVLDGHGPPVLALTDRNVAREEKDGNCDLGDSNPHHEESEVKEEDSAEEIEESQPPPRQFRRAIKTPVRFPDT